MRLYFDDDSFSPLLLKLLGKTGHHCLRPVDINLVGEDDAVHLTRAVRDGRVLFSHNHKDFDNLHELILATGGHHPGILIVRKDNDPTRDMTPRGMATALGKLIAAGVPFVDQLHILNHWR